MRIHKTRRTSKKATLDDHNGHTSWRSRRSVAVAAVLSLIAVVAFAGPVGADDDDDRDQVSVSGVAVPDEDGDCSTSGEHLFAIVMSGDLNGCLNIGVDTSDCIAGTDGAPDRLIETGPELFEGSIGGGDDDDDDDGDDDDGDDDDGRAGTFETTYVFAATFPAGSGCDFAMQLSGGCIHTIIEGSGTGAFEGVSGTIGFVDNIPSPPGGAVSFTYNAELTFDD